MIYQAYQATTDLMRPLRVHARTALAALRLFDTAGRMRSLTAAYEVFTRMALSHERLPFGIDRVRIGDEDVAVHEELVARTPFASLVRFRKHGVEDQPRVLLVAPMSGHFATLLRDTLRTMLVDHDVYITDWHNARDVSLAHGKFDLEDYTAHLIGFLEDIGPGAHVVSVCQPCVAALAAVAVMSEDGHPATPLSLTLMAGPIDTRINPSEVCDFATSRPIEWFERHVVGRVPLRYAGAMRRVYPGFMQLGAFLSMNFSRHVGSFVDLFNYVSAGDEEKADATRTFYEEYFAVTDLPAEFYLDTVRLVFQEHALPLGKLRFRGRRVDPSAIRSCALLTVEGERDDICGIGQTAAAHALCSNLPAERKRAHVQPGAGHYGVFSGRRWHNEIYPLVRALVRDSARPTAVLAP